MRTWGRAGVCQFGRWPSSVQCVRATVCEAQRARGSAGALRCGGIAVCTLTDPLVGRWREASKWQRATRRRQQTNASDGDWTTTSGRRRSFGAGLAGRRSTVCRQPTARSNIACVPGGALMSDLSITAPGGRGRPAAARIPRAWPQSRRPGRRDSVDER